jgi:predicted MFS family arabinose efflux permease
VSGPVTALLADLTRTEMRTRAMAFIGIGIGGSFILSLLAGPLLSSVLGLAGFFWVMALLALGSLVVLLTAVPTPATRTATAPASWREVYSAELVIQYTGVFALHFILMATFMAVPHVLREVHGIATADHWHTYMLVFVISLFGTAPMILATERSARAGGYVRLGIALLVIGQVVMALDFSSTLALNLGLIIYFVAFNFLEARLPARVSELAPGERRGAALGIFATSQFLGAFAGSVVGGALLGSAGGIGSVFAAAGGVAGLWWLIDSVGSQRSDGGESGRSGRISAGR